MRLVSDRDSKTFIEIAISGHSSGHSSTQHQTMIAFRRKIRFSGGHEEDLETLLYIITIRPTHASGHYTLGVINLTGDTLYMTSENARVRKYFFARFSTDTKRQQFWKKIFLLFCYIISKFFTL